MTRRPDPFAQLGLPADAGLTDDDVRAAWRRAATATHPDRPDGGDPERFAAAAAAYTALRTPFGRGEALADLRAAGRRWPAHPVSRRGFVSRVRRGRPGRLTLRFAAVVAAGVAAVAAAGAQPGTPAVITGAVTWLILTARHDIAPPR